MTRMIERWFPCAEVSASSASGWGSGNQEKNLFTWFAARPTAQAKAAVICSLLQWPDESAEQDRLQNLVRKAMTGRDSAWKELRSEILRANPEGASVLDPFSGRGMIPLEAARLGLPAYGIDYSPVAVLASELLTDYPFQNWHDEPALPFGGKAVPRIDEEPRLLRDVRTVLNEVGSRFTQSLADFYPAVEGKQPWGYLWAVTLPCQECGRRFPLAGSYELRKASESKATKTQTVIKDPGQSFYIDADLETSQFRAVVHDGPPNRTPTLANATAANDRKVKGKSAVCPFCGHVHPLGVHQRLAGERLGRDVLLLVVEPHKQLGRHFRTATAAEVQATVLAKAALSAEAPFGPLLSAIPGEEIPLNNGATIRPQLYGARTYGDLMCDRQTLAYIRLARTIADVSTELLDSGISVGYSQALSGYASAVLVRMLKFSTRGAKMRTTPGAGLIDHIFSNESTIAFSYDFLEAGLSDGPGSWPRMSAGTVATLSELLPTKPGHPVSVQRGSAVSLPFRRQTFAAVVTDPPYDAMVYYSDSSDFFFAWLKRALGGVRPELIVTPDSRGLQDKTEEIIVKEHGKAPGEHRDRNHYDTKIAQAFAEMRRTVRDTGVVTIVFGHGEPEVWQRLLGALQLAGLVMTGSWPANTEAGGQQGKANIKTTLTMACSPAPLDRPSGRKGTVEAAIKAEIRTRYPAWERWGLAPTDMLMAAAGPAMEIVGRYSEVLDAKGEPVDISTFLPLARSAVQEAMSLEIDHHPLETFDSRTRFALWWVRLFGRDIAPKSELRWQVLAASLELADVRDLVPDSGNGCRFVYSAELNQPVNNDSAAIDVALALAAVSDQGRDAMGEVLAQSGRQPDDAYLWATVKWLADRLPGSDPDLVAFNRLARTKDSVAKAATAVGIAKELESRDQSDKTKQGRFF